MQQNDGVRRIGVLLAILTAGLAAGQGQAAGGKPPAASTIPSGKELYLTHCSACHGPDGKGEGESARKLAMNPGDLTKLTAKNGGEFPTYRLRRMLGGEETMRGHGTKRMPVWGAGLDAGQAGGGQNNERIDRVVEHLRGLQAKAPAAK
jgi:mono/diheme cytochrome c family protein